MLSQGGAPFSLVGNRTQNSSQPIGGADPNHQGIWSPPRAGRVSVPTERDRPVTGTNSCHGRHVTVARRRARGVPQSPAPRGRRGGEGQVFGQSVAHRARARARAATLGPGTVGPEASAASPCRFPASRPPQSCPRRPWARSAPRNRAVAGLVLLLVGVLPRSRGTTLLVVS